MSRNFTHRIPAGIAAACLLSSVTLAIAERLGATDKLLAYVEQRYGPPRSKLEHKLRK